VTQESPPGDNDDDDDDDDEDEVEDSDKDNNVDDHDYHDDDDKRLCRANVSSSGFGGATTGIPVHLRVQRQAVRDDAIASTTT